MDLSFRSLSSTTRGSFGWLPLMSSSASSPVQSADAHIPIVVNVRPAGVFCGSVRCGHELACLGSFLERMQDQGSDLDFPTIWTFPHANNFVEQ